MKIGTKSVLFGAHQFLIHPVFVAAAWTKLYGFPTDPRLWIAFAIHDLGYVGAPNMDGPEGEAHVEFAANLMGKWFGAEWGDFCRYHSRFYAKRDGRQFSRLCVADKLAPAMEPWWLYLPRVMATGEIKEYMALAAGATADAGKYVSMNISTSSARAWHADVMTYLRGWSEEHRDMRPDTWTPERTAP